MPHIQTPISSVSSKAIQVVALYEGLKGILALAAGFGLLELVHHDVHSVAAWLIEHMHLNPASHISQIFLKLGANFQDGKLVLLAAGALAYSALRLLEAYGLLLGRTWAEVLAAGSGAVYLPIEAYELVEHPTGLHWLVLLFNLAVVYIMVRALLQRRKASVPN